MQNAGSKAGVSFNTVENRKGFLLPVLLDPCGPQSRQPVPVYGLLPAEKLLNSQRIAFASLFETQQTATHSGHDLGLAPDNPPLCILRW
jgi:hypothetical protein